VSVVLLLVVHSAHSSLGNRPLREPHAVEHPHTRVERAEYSAERADQLKALRVAELISALRARITPRRKVALDVVLEEILYNHHPPKWLLLAEKLVSIDFKTHIGHGTALEIANHHARGPTDYRLTNSVDIIVEQCIVVYHAYTSAATANKAILKFLATSHEIGHDIENIELAMVGVVQGERAVHRVMTRSSDGTVSRSDRSEDDKRAGGSVATHLAMGVADNVYGVCTLGLGPMLGFLAQNGVDSLASLHMTRKQHEMPACIAAYLAAMALKTRHISRHPSSDISDRWYIPNHIALQYHANSKGRVCGIELAGRPITSSLLWEGINHIYGGVSHVLRGISGVVTAPGTGLNQMFSRRVLHFQKAVNMVGRAQVRFIMDHVLEPIVKKSRTRSDVPIYGHLLLAMPDGSTPHGATSLDGSASVWSIAE